MSNLPLKQKHDVNFRISEVEKKITFLVRLSNYTVVERFNKNTHLHGK